MISSFSSYQIAGIVTCLPKGVHYNADLPFDEKTIQRVTKSAGIVSRRIVDEKTTASDLCVHAAQNVLDNVSIDTSKVGVLVFVTQYPDYVLPSTAHIIKERLGLPKETIAIQINEGCSGYIYGLQLVLSLMQSTKCNYGFLLAGDTTSKIISDDDSGTRPIFGDAGSATLISQGDGQISIELGSDGKGHQDIIVEEGGFRKPYAVHHNLSTITRPPSLKMNGMNVFMFGISKVPTYILQFCESSKTDLSQIDFVILHQANKMMNDRIVRKLKIPQEKALYSLQDYGNTSSASIPLTITSQLEGKVNDRTKILASGFGVGLSWGTCTFEIDQNCLLKTIEY